MNLTYLLTYLQALYMQNSLIKKDIFATIKTYSCI